MKRYFQRLGTGFAIAASVLVHVHAQSFPAKQITIIVPYAAGGPTDITARRLAEGMSKAMSANVIVDNRPGAATTIGAALVARAPKDGYTLLMAPSSTTSINPYLYRNLTYKMEDFAPISQVSRQGFAITTAPTHPAKDLKEFVTWAKAKGSPVTYGTTGTGSLTHILGEWVGRVLGVPLKEIPYRGTALSYPDLLSGRLDINIEGVSSAIPLHAGGKMKVLGVMTEERAPQMDTVGTTKEAGFSELIAYTNFGILAPAGTPPDVIEKLHAGIVAAVANPDFVSKLAAVGERAMSSPSARQFGEFLRADYVHWGPIVNALNLKLD